MLNLSTSLIGYGMRVVNVGDREYYYQYFANATGNGHWFANVRIMNSNGDVIAMFIACRRKRK